MIGTDGESDSENSIISAQIEDDDNILIYIYEALFASMLHKAE